MGSKPFNLRPGSLPILRNIQNFILFIMVEPGRILVLPLSFVSNIETIFGLRENFDFLDLMFSLSPILFYLYTKYSNLSVLCEKFVNFDLHLFIYSHKRINLNFSPENSLVYYIIKIDTHTSVYKTVVGYPFLTTYCGLCV